MPTDREIKQRVNELWDGIKNLSASKTMNYETVIALTIVKMNTLMEVVGRKEIFTRNELEEKKINLDYKQVKELLNKITVNKQEVEQMKVKQKI